MLQHKQRSERPQILVIDDHSGVLNLTIEVLRRSGYEAIGTTDAAEAIYAITTIRSLRLVLCNIDLRTSNGPAIVRRALKNRTDIGVLFMTAGTYDVRIRRTDRVIPKPFEVYELQAAVEDVIYGSQSSELRVGATERRRRI